MTIGAVTFPLAQVLVAFLIVLVSAILTYLNVIDQTTFVGLLGPMIGYFFGSYRAEAAEGRRIPGQGGICQ